MSKAATGIVVTVVCIAALAGGAYLYHRHSATQSAAGAADDGAGGDVKPVATVTVSPLTPGSLIVHESVFGAVVARPELVQIISVPYESQVTQTYVSAGQHVARGQALLQIRPSVAARATLDDARNAVAAAERDLNLVNQRYEQKLATNTELNTAQNTLRSAQNHLNGLAQVDPSKAVDLKADADALVTKIDAQPGQTLTIAAPLIELIQLRQIQAKLAVDPSMVRDLKSGKSIQLTSASSAAPIAATIGTLTSHTDPTSHLIDVFADIPANALAVDTPVIAKFEVSHGDGFIVPHDAVVPNEDGEYELFTVKGNKAVKHTVQVLADDDEQTQIAGPDLKAGDLVVVSGNYVLEDGMSVNATSAPSPATKPATVVATRPEPGDEK